MTSTAAPESAPHSRKSDPARRSRRMAALVLLAVTAAWGVTFPAIHEAVRGTDPLVFVALRMTLALVGLLLLSGRKLLAGWRGRFGQGFLLATTFYASYAFQSAGLKYTTASRSAFITGMNVVIVPLLYVPIRRRMPGLLPIIGVVLSFTGLFLLTRPATTGGMNPGDLLTLGCALAYSLYVILLESFTAKQSAEPLIGLQTVIVAVISLAVLPFVPHPSVELKSGLAIGLLVTVPVAMFTFVALTRYQARITAPRAALIYSAEPVFALAVSAVWLAERLDMTGLAGAALIFSGVLLAIRN